MAVEIFIYLNLPPNVMIVSNIERSLEWRHEHSRY